MVEKKKVFWSVYRKVAAEKWKNYASIKTITEHAVEVITVE